MFVVLLFGVLLFVGFDLLVSVIVFACSFVCVVVFLLLFVFVGGYCSLLFKKGATNKTAKI